MEEKEENIYYVYLHRRASDNNVFYVGKGKGKRSHWVYERNQRWTRTYKKHGLIVEIVFDGLTEKDAFDLEIQTIVEMKYHYGHTLCNMTNGGDGPSGYKHDAASRKKMSDRMKTAYNEEMRKRLADGLRKTVKDKPELFTTKKYSGKPWLHPNADHSVWCNANILYEYFKLDLLNNAAFPDILVFNIRKHFENGFVPEESDSWILYRHSCQQQDLTEVPYMATKYSCELLNRFTEIKEFILNGKGYINISKALGLKKSVVRNFVEKVKKNFQEESSKFEFLIERFNIVNGK